MIGATAADALPFSGPQRRFSNPLAVRKLMDR
jgi:hypothetical protein